jgi:hypothetical protein
MGSLFADWFLRSLGEAVRNAFWKSIYLRLLPEAQLQMSFLVRLVHALLCDTVPIREIVRVDFVGINRPKIDLRVLLSKVPQTEFVESFVSEFERSVSDIDKHGIWKNNTAAYLVAKGELCTSCVIFGEKLLVIGTKESESPLAGLALPMDQLARSGIELVRFTRNVIEVIIALGAVAQLVRVRQIVEKGIEMGSIVFRSPDVYTLNDFISALWT